MTTMRWIIAGSILIAFCGTVGFAGEIFGTIKEGGKPVIKGTKIEIVTAHKTYSAETDNYGSYRFFIPEKGKAALKVTINKQSASIDIFSYEKSTRCDLYLEQKEGRYNLKRK
jgi:hypothetical protein